MLLRRARGLRLYQSRAVEKAAELFARHEGFRGAFGDAVHVPREYVEVVVGRDGANVLRVLQQHQVYITATSLGFSLSGPAAESVAAARADLCRTVVTMTSHRAQARFPAAMQPVVLSPQFLRASFSHSPKSTTVLVERTAAQDAVFTVYGKNADLVLAYAGRLEGWVERVEAGRATVDTNAAVLSAHARRHGLDAWLGLLRDKYPGTFYRIEGEGRLVVAGSTPAAIEAARHDIVTALAAWDPYVLAVEMPAAMGAQMLHGGWMAEAELRFGAVVRAQHVGDGTSGDGLAVRFTVVAAALESLPRVREYFEAKQTAWASLHCDYVLVGDAAVWAAVLGHKGGRLDRIRQRFDVCVDYHAAGKTVVVLGPEAGVKQARLRVFNYAKEYLRNLRHVAVSAARWDNADSSVRRDLRTLGCFYNARRCESGYLVSITGDNAGLVAAAVCLAQTLPQAVLLDPVCIHLHNA